MKKVKLFLGVGLASLALAGSVSSDSASAKPVDCTQVEAAYSVANSMWSAWEAFRWEILNQSVFNHMAGTVAVDYYRVDNGAHITATVNFAYWGVLVAQGDREVADWAKAYWDRHDELEAGGCWMY